MKLGKYVLELIVFIAGAVVMIFELVGSRVLAPYLGTSLVVWTSLIGVILGSLSLGYYLGGKLADRRPEYRFFSLVLLIAAALIGITALFQGPIMISLQKATMSLPWRGLLAALILFAPASILLGMVSPYAVRLKIKAVETSGMTVGNLYAISTIGSISGTFAAGFFLIPFIGTNQLLYLLTAVMIAVSILASAKGYAKIKIGILILILAIFITGNLTKGKSNIIDIDTRYNRVWIDEILYGDSRQPTRILRFDPYGVQGAMFLDAPDKLVFEYTKFYRLIDHFNQEAKSALTIGGGVYSYPIDFISKHPDANMDVVELDSEITAAAREYFNLKDNKRLTIFHEDGRTFLNRTEKNYDAIFIDAYNSHLSIPYHLTTVETVTSMYNLLSSDGVVLANLISSLEGEKSKFFRAEYATFKAVFPQVYVFPVRDKNNAERLQNIILVALKSDQVPEFKSNNVELDNYLGNVWTQEIITDLPILTDNYAPVDYYTLSLM